jgi:hypothetical protein
MTAKGDRTAKKQLWSLPTFQLWCDAYASRDLLLRPGTVSANSQGDTR